jgi:pyruvate kinase
MGMAHVGIIATVGPVSRNPQTLRALSSAGMTVARLNGSHADLDWHRETIQLIRSVLPDLPILLDVPGRKIRTLQLAHEPRFSAGDRLTLTTDRSHDGREKVPVNFDGLHEQLKAGVRVFADDGTLAFLVEEVDGRDIHVRALGDGQLRSRKGINVPDVDLGRALVTSADEAMLIFAAETGVDYVGISFVESAAHVQAIRRLIRNGSPRIVAKVENQGGLDHLDEVIGASDVIMIDRGDLSVETELDRVSLFQKQIIAAAQARGKPVIVATELLHTMIENPYPTKAEISDITNAVLDGASLLMLSGETAVGRFPVEAVARLASVARVASEDVGRIARSSELPQVVRAVHALSRSGEVTGVIVLSRSGYAAGLVAAARPAAPVLAVHSDEGLARSLNLLPGVRAVHVPGFDWDASDPAEAAIAALVARGFLGEADVVLTVAASSDESRADLLTLRTRRLSPALAIEPQAA